MLYNEIYEPPPQFLWEELLFFTWAENWETEILHSSCRFQKASQSLRSSWQSSSEAPALWQMPFLRKSHTGAMWARALLLYFNFCAMNRSCLHQRAAVCDPAQSSVSLPSYTSQCVVYARDTCSGGFHVPAEFKIQPHCIMLSTFLFNKNAKDFERV